MFKNTYPAAFYKQLHRYVHKNYRKHLASQNIKKIFNDPGSIDNEKYQKSGICGILFAGDIFCKEKIGGY